MHCNDPIHASIGTIPLFSASHHPGFFMARSLIWPCQRLLRWVLFEIKSLKIRHITEMSIILWVLSVFTDLAIWAMDFHISLESVLCPVSVYCAITYIQISILLYVAIAPEPREITEALVLWGHKPEARIKLLLRLHTSWSMPQILT